MVDVAIGDATIPVAFDLCGDNTIELTTSALEKLNVRYLPERYTWLDAKGHRLEARMFVIAELRIGDAVFTLWLIFFSGMWYIGPIAYLWFR